jgi:fatty acid-binding protein DegV
MTIIIADTTCSLPRNVLKARGIPLIPQVVMFGEESFHDDNEIDTATFLQKLKASTTLPKTAAPEPTLYYPVFKQAQAKGESVIVVAPVLLADDLAKAGKSANEIVAKLNYMIPRGRIYFLVATLEYLAKGGRIGGAKKLLAELLEIKPILTIRAGQVEPFEQQRTHKRALARLEEVVREQCPKSPEARLAVMQVEAEAEARLMAASLQSWWGGGEVPICELPPAIVTHGGPKTMGVGFFI